MVFDMILNSEYYNYAQKLYWVYLNESGQPIYTQGIPAQKIVYDAVKVTKKEFNRLAEKRLKEALEI